jgi:antitoxin ParD1/3/4
MDISLPPELEAFIESKVRAGDYADGSAVVRQALELLKSNEELLEQDTEELRRQIALGIDEADRGLATPWNPDEVWAEVERRHAEEIAKANKKVG